MLRLPRSSSITSWTPRPALRSPRSIRISIRIPPLSRSWATTYKNDPAANISPEIFAKGQYIENIDKAVDIYNDMWAKFTS